MTSGRLQVHDWARDGFPEYVELGVQDEVDFEIVDDVLDPVSRDLFRYEIARDASNEARWKPEIGPAEDRPH